VSEGLGEVPLATSMDFSESIERAISNYFSQWLEQHTYLAWAISHPLPSLGLLVVAIFTLSGLFKAIGRGFEQIWLFLLKTPFKLLQPIFRLIWSLIRRIFGNTNSSTSSLSVKPVQIPTAEQIDLIVDRLQALTQEQESLLGELSTLMSSSSVKSDTNARSDTKYKKM
jgi:hypothetical protein